MTPLHLLAALPDAAILTDPDGVVVGWNDSASQQFGWKADEMIGRPVLERIPAPARNRVDAHLRQRVTDGDWDGEFEDYRKDGSRVWLEWHVHPVRDHGGRLSGVLGVSRPVAHAHDEYTADILNSMSAHVAVLGADGRIVDVNRAWVRFAEENTPGGEAPPTTDIGVDYVALCRASRGENSEEADAAASGIEAVLRGTRSLFVLEYPCDSPTHQRWFAMHVSPLNGGRGGAVVAHYDITDRKLAELALAEQYSRTELALSAAHMGVWTLDLTTRRIEWSAELHSILGVSEFDGRYETWAQLVHPEDLPVMEARFAESIERRLPFVGEFRIIRPTGEVRWLSNVAQVECDPSGAPVFAVGTAQDITTRKRSEWALAAYNHILEMIAAGADRQRILTEVVRLVEEQLPGSLCSVLIVDKAAGRLRFGAGPSLPAEYNRAVDGVVIGPKAGSCGTAAYRRTTVTVTDIASDPLWDDYRAVALAHGLQSCVSVPILSSGNVPGFERGEAIGTFALYNRTPGEFNRVTYAILTGAEALIRRAVSEGPVTDEESARVIEAAHLAGVAIERDQAGEALRESEERFRAVFDSAPSAIYVRDLEGRHLYANDAMSAMFGVPKSAWLGRQARELLPHSVAEICELGDHAALAGQGPVERRHACRLHGDRDATVLVSHMLLRNGNGEPYAVCGILRDITDLVAAQQEFERLWLHSPEPLCVAGFEGYFTRINPAWSQLSGWSEAELLGRPWSEFVHPDDVEKTNEMRQQLLSGRTVHRFVNRFRCADGRYRWLSWDAIPLLAEQVLYGFVRDITEERDLEQRLRHSQKLEAIGQLASGVAHDFNNLLTVINGYTEILLAGMDGNDPQRDPMTQVLHAGQRASELTGQLLAFSRKAIIEPKVLDVNHVVESSARMLVRLIGEQVRLDTILHAVPPVRVDPGQLEQVFVNLAVNARDAMPEGGRLTISTSVVDVRAGDPEATTELSPGQYVRVSVSDTGSGMTDDVKSKVFEPFFTTKGPGRRTGLGLATVYGIARQAGGAITVESQAGVGTTFHLLLPAVPESTGGAALSPASVSPRGNETVLIAEDELGVRDVARAMLGALGYTVLVAGSGAEALRVAAAHEGPIHLLLTDVVMPDVGGRALAESIRKQRTGIRVLLMSGYTDDAVLRQAIESAQDWFIQKPFTPLALARKVRDVLDGTDASAGG